MEKINFPPVLESQTEEQLRETINSYRALIAASGIGAWEYHIDTGFLNCNDVYFTMLGKEIPENGAPGRSNLDEAWINLLHPEDLAPAKEKFFTFLTGMGEDSYEHFFRLSHPSKGWIWIWSRGKLIFDKDGAPERVIGTHMDVSLQKETEQLAIKDRVLLRTLIDNLPDAIYVKDEHGRKVIANAADVVSIGAVSEADIIGKTDLELFPGVIGQRGYDDDQAILTTGQPLLNKEESFGGKDGEKRWLLTSKIPVYDETGAVRQLLGIGHDITLRKKNEEAIISLNNELKKQAEHLIELNEQLAVQQEQELEKALAQGRFEIASEVLHDIGNALVGFGSHLTKINKITSQANMAPAESLTLFLSSQKEKLNEIFGSAKATALIDLSTSLAAAQHQNNAEISTAVKELLHIVTHVQEILNIQRQFVRMQEVKQDRKPVDLRRIAEDCRSMMQANFSRKGITFNLTVQQGDYLFNGDQTKIMQVMLNIQKNAIEAIPHDSLSKHINMTLKNDGDWIELQLTDTGTGFDAETAGQLFRRGFTTKESGTGLGLYSCRSIIESHNGSFEISSSGRNQGSTVVVKLPKLVG